MTRRLPNCAGCGKPLGKAKARMVSEFTSVRGRPSLGGCFDESDAKAPCCADSIPNLHGPDRVPLAPVLRMIAARGPGRVTLLGGVSLDEACVSAEALDRKRGR